ncbi:MAG: gamma-glutamylcyclotransferase, partial [Pseudomonadales bacterium]|nr:gamma-glutamylcyclotransferase [Pseudomonadales bacterium]
MKVFVYGTLLKGMVRANVLSASGLIDHGFIEASLHDLGDYPSISSSNDSEVFGEIYEINAETLSILDNIEGFCPEYVQQSLYIRRQVMVKGITMNCNHDAWTYFFNGELSNKNIITCGDYRRYVQELSRESFWYIAYGSNMDIERLEQRIGKPKDSVAIVLDGYKLTFNKRDGNGDVYANLMCHLEAKTPAVAWRIDAEQLAKLDYFEGTPLHYLRIGFAFQHPTEGASLGQAYLANPKKLVKEQTPNSNYLRFISNGYQD